MRFTLLQKEIIFWLVFFLLCAGAGVFYINHMPNAHPGIIRLHVVANSNSAEDQALKLKVRNEILKLMGGRETLDTARNYINDNLDEITEAADSVIQKNGFDYPARASLAVSYIPEKSYEDLTLPGGSYEALKITLGKGEGQNWWCVIFPQLCLIGEENGREEIVLKSKVKELLQSRDSAADPAERESDKNKNKDNDKKKGKEPLTKGLFLISHTDAGRF